MSEPKMLHWKASSRGASALWLLLLLGGTRAWAQGAPDTTARCATRAELMLPPLAGGDLARVAELTGLARLQPRLMETPWSDLRLRLCGETPGPLARLAQVVDNVPGAQVEVLPAVLISDYNSAYPRDRDNGAVWAGKGLSAGVSAGVRLRWGVFSAALAPMLTYQQNNAFQIVPATLAGYSQFTYPYNVIDWPQRFGAGSFSAVDPGESYARIDMRGLALGFSTENLRWGPALWNPLLLSYNAPGFPHAFAGTSHPLNLGIGRGEGMAVWGRLTESQFFDTVSTNNNRIIAGLIFDFEPRWLPGLFLGASEIYEAAEPVGGATPGDYLRALLNHPTSDVGNLPGNGLLSLFARWALPGSGFEVYTEWGRDDYAWNFTDIIKEPDHSQVYTLGLQKVVVSSQHWVRLMAELTHLEASQTLRSGRGVVTFYTHGDQGHTQEGQLLGAAIGPGSDGQYLGADVFSRWGSLGGYVERVAYDNNTYYNIFARTYGMNGHDVEITAGLRPSLYWNRWAVTGDVTLSHRYDRNFIGEDGTNWNLRSENNLGARLSFSWWPGTRGRAAAFHLLAPHP